MGTAQRGGAAASPCRRRAGVSSFLRGLALLSLLAARVTVALPAGEEVVSGRAEFQRSGARLDILQGTDRAIINYTDFSIGASETVNFLQPGANAAALNRVPHGPISTIAGRLTANGRIMLINPSGVVFTDSATVSVHGLIASALDIADQDFLLDNYVFSDGATGAAVVNEGEIVTDAGGRVFLVAPEVVNAGTIDAPDGEVGLLAGSQVYLTDDPFGHVVFEVPQSAGEARNQGSITSRTGRIDLYGAVVNQDGVVAADGIETDGGRIRLVASDTARLGPGSATTARSEAGRGGEVRVHADRVGLDAATLDVSGAAGGGVALIGGDYGGQGDLAPASRTIVGRGSTICADADEAGDGGNVIVWAEQNTAFHGVVSARGGAEGGDGGFAEVSGGESLAYAGSADLGAPRGRKGTLLLDPKNISVQSSGDARTAEVDEYLDSSAEDAYISPDTIVTALRSADVRLAANTDIVVEEKIDATGLGTSGALNFYAGRGVILNADVLLVGPFSATANHGNALPEYRDAGAARFYMAPGTHLNASRVTGKMDGGGSPGDTVIENITVDADADFDNHGNGTIYVNGTVQAPGGFDLQGDPLLNGGIVVTGNVQTGGGGITMDAGGTVNIPGHIETTGGSIYLKGAEIGHGMAMELTSMVSTGTGSIELISMVGDVTAGAISGEGRVTIDSANAILPGPGGPDVTGADIELIADTGIGGSQSPLQIDADRLAAGTRTGAIYLEDSPDALEVTALNSTVGLSINESGETPNGDHIHLTAAGPVTVTAPVTNLAGGDVGFVVPELPGESRGIKISAHVTATGGGDIQFQPGGDFLMGADVTAEDGDIGIWPAGPQPTILIAGALSTQGNDLIVRGYDVIVDGNGLVHNQGAGYTDIAADHNLMVQGEVRADHGTLVMQSYGLTTVSGLVSVLGSDLGLHGGELVIQDGAVISNPSAGSLYLTATAGDAAVTGIQGGGHVRVKAAGAVLDAGESVTDIVAPDMELIAATGIAESPDHVEIDADRLAATTESGGIWIDDLAGGVQVTTVGETTGLSVTDGTEDDIHLTAFSPLNISADVTDVGGGRIILGAEGTAPTDDLTVDAGVTVAATGGGSIELSAGSDIVQGGDIQAEGGDILLAANDRVSLSGSVVTDEGDISIVALQFDPEAGSVVSAPGGQVTIQAAGGQDAILAALLAEIGSLAGQSPEEEGEEEEEEEHEEEEEEKEEEEEVAAVPFPLAPSRL